MWCKWPKWERNYQHPDKPDKPMCPDELQLEVDKSSNGSDKDEAKEHRQHCLDSRLVRHILPCPLIGEIQHFVSCDVAIRVGNGPFELLQILLLLHLWDYCHFRFGNHQVGSRSEPKLTSTHWYHFEDWAGFPVEVHRDKEHWVLHISCVSSSAI